MIKLDHMALTINNLEESINFYTKLGYILTHKYDGWATLKLNNSSLELFESDDAHLALSYDTDKEIIELLNKLNIRVEELDIFYGNLNRKSFFIKDNSGNKIQFIKRK